MTRNQILQQLRHVLELKDADMLQIFQRIEAPISQATLRGLLSKPASKSHILCTEQQLSVFLEGLILTRRGPGDKPPQPLASLSHNAVLKKLRIALELKEPELLNIFEAGGKPLSRYELGALFRAENNKHYVACSDALLGQFFKGLEKHRC